MGLYQLLAALAANALVIYFVYRRIVDATPKDSGQVGAEYARATRPEPVSDPEQEPRGLRARVLELEEELGSVKRQLIDLSEHQKTQFLRLSARIRRAEGVPGEDDPEQGAADPQQLPLLPFHPPNQRAPVPSGNHGGHFRPLVPRR